VTGRLLLPDRRFGICCQLCHVWLIWGALSYSARRYDSAICWSKMSRDAFLSEALYEADKLLKMFA